MKIDQHELYKKLINEYPWLFTESQTYMPEEDYIRHFDLGKSLWYPYINYYSLSVLEDIREKFYNFTAIVIGQGFTMRGLFQISRDTHAYGLFSKHPEAKEDTVMYFDIKSNKPEEVLQFYKDIQKHEYVSNGKSAGFSFGLLPK